MSPTQNLFYALGEMAYAIATADGAIQKEERNVLHQILDEEFKNQQWDFDYSEIIFYLLEKDKTDLNTAYKWAIREMKNNSDYLSPVMKKKFTTVIEKVAEAFPPVTNEEKAVIDKFIREINEMPGRKAASAKPD